MSSSESLMQPCGFSRHMEYISLRSRPLCSSKFLSSIFMASWKRRACTSSSERWGLLFAKMPRWFLLESGMLDGLCLRGLLYLKPEEASWVVSASVAKPKAGRRRPDEKRRCVEELRCPRPSVSSRRKFNISDDYGLLIVIWGLEWFGGFRGSELNI